MLRFSLHCSGDTFNHLTLGIFLALLIRLPLRAQNCWPTDDFVTQHINRQYVKPISQPTGPSNARPVVQAEVPFAPGTSILNVVALGTSLMWGDGLKEEETFRYRVADWLAQQTARPVQLTTFAHSSAYLGDPPPGVTVGPNPAPTIGDINSFVPNVDDQIACATSEYSLSPANLVIVDGCINEVDPYSIVAPWTKTIDLESNARAYCGGRMRETLEKIKISFPSATVVVVGYYPLISSASSLFGFKSSRRLVKHLEKVHRLKEPNFSRPKTGDSRAEEINIMVLNSEAFYQQSKMSLRDAVDSANGNGPERFFFAGLPEPARDSKGLPIVDPKFAYGARETHEWMLPVRFLWWVFDKDEKYWYRYPLCEEYSSIGLDRLECEMNSAFHPDPNGAEVYATSIEHIIPESVVTQWRAN
jgi:hypothetical protein